MLACRRLLTMDEVLRLDVDKALVIIRGRNILEVDKFDYSKHYEAKKLRPIKRRRTSRAGKAKRRWHRIPCAPHNSSI